MNHYAKLTYQQATAKCSLKKSFIQCSPTLLVNFITVCIHFTHNTLPPWAELLTNLMASQLRISNKGLLLPHQKAY